MVDWYPTLLKLAGATLEQKLPLDGRDAWPTIAAGKPTPHEDILHQHDTGQRRDPRRRLEAGPQRQPIRRMAAKAYAQAEDQGQEGEKEKGSGRGGTRSSCSTSPTTRTRRRTWPRRIQRR